MTELSSHSTDDLQSTATSTETPAVFLNVFSTLVGDFSEEMYGLIIVASAEQVMGLHDLSVEPFLIGKKGRKPRILK